MQTLRLAMLSAMVLTSACAPVVFERPCPQVTDFPAALQQEASVELSNAPALTRMMDAMAADRAFNREVCPAQ